MDEPSRQSEPLVNRVQSAPPLWLVLLLSSLAGGMGWGIRGQYGHETGAMIPGMLVALVIVFLFSAPSTSLRAVRSVSLAAIGISLGGSMTYGQTIGLTHDAELLGNWAALRWGMLGLLIKGGVWIGLAGAMLGMGLSRKRYRTLEMVLLTLTMTMLMFLGLYLLNEPFDPGNHQLPCIYFSDHWHWEPDKVDLTPRRECWGGLLFALVGLTVYVGLVKKDRLARNLALIGTVSGGLGFALGQCLQAYHAWNPDRFQGGLLGRIDPYMNWWNTMEITFGLVLGMGLGLGVWLGRALVDQSPEDDEPELRPAAEWVCVVLYAMGLIGWSFMSFAAFDQFAGHAVTVMLVPLIGVVGGRTFPYLFALPLLAVPIAGKTLRQLSYRTDQIATTPGWLFLLVLPLVMMFVAALWFQRRGRQGQNGRSFGRWALCLTSWFYFTLNFAFFEFPWPWEPPTGRSISAAIFTLCVVTLTLGALSYRIRPTPRFGE